MKRVLICVMLILAGTVYAQEEATKENYLQVNILKMFAKSYVNQCDLAKLKSKKIKIIDSLTDEQFKRDYALYHSYIKQTSPRYGFKPNMSKGQVISRINSLNKQKLSKMIDGLNPAFVEKQIQKRLSKSKTSSNGKSSGAGSIWNEVLGQLKL